MGEDLPSEGLRGGRQRLLLGGEHLEARGPGSRGSQALPEAVRPGHRSGDPAGELQEQCGAEDGPRPGPSADGEARRREPEGEAHGQREPRPAVAVAAGGHQDPQRDKRQGEGRPRPARRRSPVGGPLLDAVAAPQQHEAGPGDQRHGHPARTREDLEGVGRAVHPLVLPAVRPLGVERVRDHVSVGGEPPRRHGQDGQRRTQNGMARPSALGAGGGHPERGGPQQQALGARPGQHGGPRHGRREPPLDGGDHEARPGQGEQRPLKPVGRRLQDPGRGDRAQAERRLERPPRAPAAEGSRHQRHHRAQPHEPQPARVPERIGLGSELHERCLAQHVQGAGGALHGPARPLRALDPAARLHEHHEGVVEAARRWREGEDARGDRGHREGGGDRPPTGLGLGGGVDHGSPPILRYSGPTSQPPAPFRAPDPPGAVWRVRIRTIGDQLRTEPAGTAPSRPPRRCLPWSLRLPFQHQTSRWSTAPSSWNGVCPSVAPAFSPDPAPAPAQPRRADSAGPRRHPLSDLDLR